MTNQNTSFHQELLATFADLNKEFNTSLAEAKMQEQEFRAVCEKFQRNIDRLLKDSAEKLSKNNPLSNQIREFIEQVEKTNDTWQQRIKQQDTGVRFREGFNDSLLVFVFGKVKSGKSSLGNYMAWGHTDPDAELKSNIPKGRHPVYFSHANSNAKGGDAEKEAEKNREFRVGATEATSSIQGFRLPGLTWVDSPGLHSVKGENGKLAKDYVKHADLILYTMKSDAPGRESDVQEIAGLHAADKRTLMLLTGSDTTEEDENDEGELVSTVVMKSAETQKQQQKAVREALESVEALKYQADKMEIVSFSARYAQLHANDPKEFEKSGMPALFKVFNETAKSEGIKLKQQVPLTNFRNYLKTFESDLDAYEKLLRNFDEPIKSQQRTIPNEISKQTRALEREMTIVINQEFDKLENQRDDTVAMSVAIKNMSKTLQNELQKRVQSTQANISMQVMSNLDEKFAEIADQSAFFQLPEFAETRKKEKIFSSVSGGTKKRNRGIGSFIGGVAGGLVGALAGGPMGLAAGVSLGAMAGSQIGEATGEAAQRHFEEIDIKTGDNLADIRLKTEHGINEAIQANMMEFERNIVQKSLHEADSLIKGIEAEIQTMKDFIHQQQRSIENKLNS